VPNKETSREKRAFADRVVVIANIYVVGEGERVGEVKGVVPEMHPVAHVEVKAFEVIGVAGPVAAFVYAKVQDCRGTFIECVVILALRGSSFSDNGNLSLLISGTSVGR